MKIEVVRIVRAELEGEEFDVIVNALAYYQDPAHPKHESMALKMRDELMTAMHGDPDPF